MGARYLVIVRKTDFAEAAIFSLVCPWAAARFDPIEPNTNADPDANGPGRLARRFGGHLLPSIVPSAHRSTGVEEGQSDTPLRDLASLWMARATSDKS